MAREANIPGQAAGMAREGDAFVISGALTRASVATLWPRALAQVAGVRRFDLGGATSVDSAGLALLAELAARAGNSVTVSGDPPGLAALRAAYRLDAGLGFAST